MRDLVKDFPNHMRDAFSIAEKYRWTASKDNFQNIVVSGLGGSGIGGTIVSQILSSSLEIPFVVNKTYGIPELVNSKTLFVASSYSGNTEETLEAVEKAAEKGATIACLTSGGKLLELAEKNNYHHIVMPVGFPPRAAFGYSSTLLFHLLGNYGFVTDQIIEDLSNVPDMIDEHSQEILQEAELLGECLVGQIPVLYSDARMEGVAVRYRQQINENSKMLCWHHALPEMNHNELVGWADDHPNVVPVFLRTKRDYYRTKERMEFSKDLMTNRKANCVEINADFDSDVLATYYLISIGDWASVLIAEKRGIDPVEVDVITKLKNKLSNI